MAEVWIRGVSHMNSEEVDTMCQSRRGVEEITDECAVSIAALWQSPGRDGAHFAALASGAKADTDGLMNDIHMSYMNDVPGLPASEQLAAKLQLDMLATWVLAKISGALPTEEVPMCATCGERPWGFGYCGEECSVCADES